MQHTRIKPEKGQKHCKLKCANVMTIIRLDKLTTFGIADQVSCPAARLTFCVNHALRILGRILAVCRAFGAPLAWSMRLSEVESVWRRTGSGVDEEVGIYM
jgi:hypothetical protein